MSSEHVIVGTKLGKQRPNFALSFGSSFNDDDDDLVVQDDFDLNDYDDKNDGDGDDDDVLKMRTYIFKVRVSRVQTPPMFGIFRQILG